MLCLATLAGWWEEGRKGGTSGLAPRTHHWSLTHAVSLLCPSNPNPTSLSLGSHATRPGESNRMASESIKKKTCEWRGCKISRTVSFKTIEDVLEHVILEHIPKIVEDEDGEEMVVCEWQHCEMGTTRGCLEKKTDWMKNHFKTRHAKTAKTFKCLFKGCKVIRGTSQEIETHVRTCHPMIKRKTESKEVTPKPLPGPVKPPNRVWRIVDGRPIWDEQPIVTKKTIVHYDDGPRYIFPAGCGRCNYFSDESELASDEEWEHILYDDSEESRQKSWRPPEHYNPRMGPSFVEIPKWYDVNHPPDTDSDEEERRSRPRRVKRKKAIKELAKRDRLHRAVEKIAAVKERAIEEKNVKKEEKKKEEEESQFIGSFWHNYLLGLKASKLEDEPEPERELSAPPELIMEPKKLLRKAKLGEMPTLTAHYDEDSEPDEIIIKSDKLKRPRTPKSLKKRPSRACRTNYSLCEIDEEIEAFEVTMDFAPNIFDLATKSELKRARPHKSIEEPKSFLKIIKSSPKSLSRPSRACRVLGSMEEVPFDVEIGVEFEFEKPIRKKRAKDDNNNNYYNNDKKRQKIR
uniref:C2H2-type domain-containing protein n=1 Tax=Caenorhabditis japonica TaxID=281687 RepID=A0A8R1HJI4_CAEJA